MLARRSIYTVLAEEKLAPDNQILLQKARKTFRLGVNGVNRLATKGEKILLTTDKTRKKLPTSDKKIN